MSMPSDLRGERKKTDGAAFDSLLTAFCSELLAVNGKSRATVETYMYALNMFFSWCNEKKIILSNITVNDLHYFF